MVQTLPASRKYLIVGAWVLGLTTAAGLAAGDPAAKPEVPAPFLMMYGHSDNPGVNEEFMKLLPRYTALEGTCRSGRLIKQFKALGVMYAAHVINPVTATKAQLVEAWSAPFKDTLGGELPAGYEAIAIDELRNDPDGTEQSQRVCGALQEVRNVFPHKLIFAASTWHLGHPGHSDRNREQLRAVNKYVDILMLESYHREANFAYGNLRDYAAQINAYPGLIEKTVIGIGISQDGRVCGGGHMYDDSPDKGFLGCLDFQLHTIRNDPLASRMPGAMFWAYYRTEVHITPDFVARLCDHYYLKGRTTPLGDGRFTQFISNPIFAHGTDGWVLAQGEGGSVGLFEYDPEQGPRNLNRSSQYTKHGVMGLKMVRGTTANRASYTVTEIDTKLVHVVSAFARPATGARATATVSIVDAGGRAIAAKQVSVADHDPPRDWTRIIFKFIPSTPRIRIVLSDGNTAEGSTLYWDFIELEDAYPAP
jgi:hypothetical protein